MEPSQDAATADVAARIARAADPGRTLVAKTVAELRHDPGSTFEEADPLDLKGFDEPVLRGRCG